MPIINGTAVSGCLYLAAFADSAEVTTVASLDASGSLEGERPQNNPLECFPPQL